VRAARRGNLLDGRTWTRHSISVWSDIRKSKEELALKHPALFPVDLPRRIIECFLPPDGRVVLDPFCGFGSTVLAAHQLERVGVGLDISPDYIEAAQRRLGDCPDCRLIRADAAHLAEHLPPASADLAITSPPYWDILTRRRSADRKQTRHYGDRTDDLGRIADYQEFLDALGGVFGKVREALRPGAYCVVVVMDLRKGSRFYPFHSDFAAIMQETGYILDDMIIWDRRQEYNNFRPLGYPSVFRVNKAHEFILIFQNPR
jgi:DNA modification methylase